MQILSLTSWALKDTLIHIHIGSRMIHSQMIDTFIIYYEKHHGSVDN
jgi:hypothetical protein